MTAYKSLSIIAMGLFVGMGCICAYADGDVTIVSAPPNPADGTATKMVNADGTLTVHKSLHKSPTDTSNVVVPVIITPGANRTGVTTSTGAVPVSPAPSPALVSATGDSATLGPPVETGLPVARHSGSSGTMLASSFPPGSPASAITTAAMATYVPAGKPNNFPFAEITSKKPANKYPWKANIITTKFWIGEPGSNVSSTTNHASAWIEDWRSANGGTDNPDDRIGYEPADHAAQINPFYVALPFNDLADPEKARRWLPAGWYRPPRDGKQVSACKDRWVEIKNAEGRTCYAQWEDVGPLESDHAEYVFGDERPETLTRAGLDVSPAVFQFLGLDENKRSLTSWRFVDAEDVPPGFWLVYDEWAVFNRAFHQKNATPNVPFQNGSEPIDDSATTKANKKKLGSAKG